MEQQRKALECLKLKHRCAVRTDLKSINHGECRDCEWTLNGSFGWLGASQLEANQATQLCRLIQLNQVVLHREQFWFGYSGDACPCTNTGADVSEGVELIAH